MELIQNYELASDGATAIYLDSLPNTYNKIVIYAEFQDHTSNPNNIGSTSFRINNVTTSYTGVYFGHSGSSTDDSSVNTSNLPNGISPMNNPRVGIQWDTRSTLYMELPNYNVVNQHNHVIWNTGFFNLNSKDPSWMQQHTGYAYHQSTNSAVTSIAYFSRYGFRSGTKIRVYGV
jgi:hypothetical protein